MFEKIMNFFTKGADELEKANEEIKRLNKENAELRLLQDEKHNCTGFCSVCKHGIKAENLVYGYGVITNYLCEFNCKCSDFERVK